MRLTEVAQTWLAEVLEKGDIVVDATLGNGFDALFLAQHIGREGHIYGFDVQKEAINASQKLLQDQPCQHDFFLAGHEAMASYIPKEQHGDIKAIMFNLGWLPNSDKSIITHAKTTITALGQSLELLAPKGRLSVMVYPGHQGGDDEAIQVIHWLEQTCASNENFTYKPIILPNRPTAPILLQMTKL